MSWAFIMLYFILFSSCLSIVWGSPFRIVNGQLAGEHEFRGMLSLQYNGIHLCGAAVLNTDWAVTAAHCFHVMDGFSVLAGTTDLVNGGTKHHVVEIVPHPEFNLMASWENDIALFKVSESFSSNPDVMPMLTADPSFNVAEGTNVTAIGWGFTQENEPQYSQMLRKAELVIWNHQECYSAYLTQSLSVHSSQVCAAHPQFLYGTCEGDSGGPLVVPDTVTGGPPVIVGIESWSLGCARQGFPTVYTKISDYYDWIFSVLGK